MVLKPFFERHKFIMLWASLTLNVFFIVGGLFADRDDREKTASLRFYEKERDAELAQKIAYRDYARNLETWINAGARGQRPTAPDFSYHPPEKLAQK